MAATPTPPPPTRSTLSSVTRIRAPLAPMGCPSATLPPCALTRSAGSCISFRFARSTTEKASLTSQKSTSRTDRPARCSAFGTASAGAVVNHSGAVAASACARTRASTGRPSAAAFARLHSTSAAAPSVTGLALPAVTVPLPSFANTVRSRGSFVRSILEGPSSAETTRPFGSVTGTTSQAVWPMAAAALARAWLSAACASWSALLKPCFDAHISAHAPMCTWLYGSHSPSLISPSTTSPCPMRSPWRLEGM
mmetsp:Transcript_25459/g.75251  ORF Transcript_25459/g.75251 Transcript_25459/m.75251 type:complete len:252 (-) Transcript_25459:953-1708(-)